MKLWTLLKLGIFLFFPLPYLFPIVVGQDQNIGEVKSSSSPIISEYFEVPVSDLPYFRYYIGILSYNGAGYQGVTPDGNGILNIQKNNRILITQNVESESDQRPANSRFLNTDSNGQESEYLYLFAQDLDTGELFYTIDIPAVPLKSLVRSISLTLAVNEDDDAKREIIQDVSMRQIRQQDEFNDVFLAIHGEKMSLDETLEQIYLLTGCAVYRQSFALEIESCN